MNSPDQLKALIRSIDTNLVERTNIESLDPDEVLLMKDVSDELDIIARLVKSADIEWRKKANTNIADAVINASSVNIAWNQEAQLKALQELKRHAYGKVVTLETEPGTYRKYRIAQANCSQIKDSENVTINVLNRLAPLASLLVTSEIGENIEFNSQYVGRVVAIDYLERYPFGQENNFARIDYISDQLSYYPEEETPLRLTNLSAALREWKERITQLDYSYEAGEIHIDEAEVAFDPNASVSLGSSFYTRTTKSQEELLLRPNRGLTVVQGIAGSGKTSVALGRIKQLRDASREHPDTDKYDDFFRETNTLAGFVLHEQLVPYLKNACADLDLADMRVLEFKELQHNLIRKYAQLLQLKVPGNPDGKYRRCSNCDVFEFEYDMPWFSAIEKSLTITYMDLIHEAFNSDPDWIGEVGLVVQFRDVHGIHYIRYQALLRVAWNELVEYANNIVLRRRKSPAKSGLYAYQLIKDLDSIYKFWSNMVGDQSRWYLEDGQWTRHPKNIYAPSLLPFHGEQFDQKHLETLRRLRDSLRGRVRRHLRLGSIGEKSSEPIPRLGDWYSEVLRSDLLRSKFGRDKTDAILERITKHGFSDTDLNILLGIALLMGEGHKGKDLAYYIEVPPYYSSIFIDEVQDFSEVQVFIMALQADPARRAVTVVGDFRQQLYRYTVKDITRCFPIADSRELIPFKLKENKRQKKSLANYSAYFRQQLGDDFVTEPVPQPVFNSSELTRVDIDSNDLYKTIIDFLNNVPAHKSVAVICPSDDIAKGLEEDLRHDIEKTFRSSHYSKNSTQLNKPYYIHFTTPRPTKGLEFDVVIATHFNLYDMQDHIESNSAYVAISRPRDTLHIINVV